MLRWIIAAGLFLLGAPAAAQLNLPAQLTYTIPEPAPPSVVPADSETPVVVPETYDLSPYLANNLIHYIESNYPGSQAKARFACDMNGQVAWIDQLRGPYKKPFGHLHVFFGGTTVDQGIVDYLPLRAAANAKATAGVLASSCPGGRGQGSLYWQPAIVVQNALGDGVTRVKKANGVNLYYYWDDPTTIGNIQRLRPNLGLVFGMNMDDPNNTAFAARITAANTANPSLALQVPGPTQGEWLCDGDQNIYRTLNDGAGNPTFQCAAGNTIYARLTSNNCWNGHLKAIDGYSNTIPQIRSNNDGKLHCPGEYPFRLPTIQTIFRYSHMGPNDYKRWRLSSDDMVAAMLGHAVGGGYSLHTDYIFDWDLRLSDSWQCSIGIHIAGRTCNTARDLDYSTIGPLTDGGTLYRLISDGTVPESGGKLLVNINNNFTGALVTDWLPYPPKGVRGAATIHAHGM